MQKQPTSLQTREQSILNNPCGICRGMKFPPPCKGHGGKGESKGDSAESSYSDDQAAQTYPVDNVTSSGKITMLPPELKPAPMFIRKLLSDLFDNGQLIAILDRDSGKLTIKCDASLLNVDEQASVDAYANSLLQELDAFRKEHHLEKPCYQLELDNNGHLKSLTITLPTPALFDAFIQQLNDKALLPNQNNQFPTPKPPVDTKNKAAQEEQKTSWQAPKPTPYKE